MDLNYYKVAGHVFSVNVSLPENYEPFIVKDLTGISQESVIFNLQVKKNVPFENFKEETRQIEEGQEIVCGNTADGKPVFVFSNFGYTVAQLVCSANFQNASLALTDCDSHAITYALNNSLMVLYALAMAKLDTALFHGAVVDCGGTGYMFLGESGTGKSTHARLWLKHISNTELLNDDNPVVRVFHEGSKIYGSPWSGKTPCYKNRELPLGGMVLLSQAPFNKIERLYGVNAFAALVPCISGMRWNRGIADGLFNTENALASSTPVWHLECLPDEAAARLCFENVGKV